MANILLGVTGSVAAIYTRELFEALIEAGHTVKVVATKPALHFFDPTQIAPREPNVRNPEALILDEDEWTSARYQRGDPVLHIELRRWADALVIAPLDANSLAKLALGLCDNCLTCVYRAWDRNRPVVLAPAMNTLMWEHPATARHLAQIAEDLTAQLPPRGADSRALIAWINARLHALVVVPPVVKTLACEEEGLGAMAGRDAILAALQDRLAMTRKP